MLLKNKNLFNSFFFKKLYSKLFIKGNKIKYLSKVFNILKTLKKLKIKPNFFFFLILEKIKPIFFFSKIIRKKKKKKKITYKPIFLSIKQQYLVSIKWLLLPLNKKYKKNFFENLLNCFLVFLNNRIKNLSLFQKKKTYLVILKYKRFIKI